jgi:hypothetical protein
MFFNVLVEPAKPNLESSGIFRFETYTYSALLLYCVVTIVVEKC